MTRSYSLPPGGTTTLRGVGASPGWLVYGGSLLVWPFKEKELRSSTKVAAFDFDGCLADTPLGGFDPNAWSMQFPHVPLVLRSLFASGHTLVVITNESMDRYKKPEAITSCMRKKVGRLTGFASAVGVPILVLCATAKDNYRKPHTGAWDFFKQVNGSAVDLASSFFVGDAAGRQGDHSDSDREFARGAGLTFHDEKTFFQQIYPPQ